MANERRHLEIRPDSGYYRYVRKVPLELRGLDPRKVIKQGLGTRDHATAVAKAAAIDESVEAYWSSLLAGRDGADERARRAAALRLAKALGFAYRPAAQILENRDELLTRLLALRGREEQLPVVEAVLGTAAAPKLSVSGTFDEYMRHKEVALRGYSESQLKKHRQPKERAAAYLLSVIGDKVLGEITRDDVLEFRDWWADKIDADGLTIEAANRSFGDIKGMLTVIDEALKTDYRPVWSGLRFKRRGNAPTRPPFAPEFIQTEILVPGRLDSLNVDARLIVYAMIETGARPSELCNLRPENIRLDHAVPHIEIVETDERIVKSDNANRVIPLVGVSLWAMRQAPEGFSRYRDNEDSLSATVNKSLGELRLRPTPRHTLYSLRHSFQDRIQHAPDRLQVDLMGHRFERAKYGAGSTLEAKMEFLDGIKFKWEETE